MEVPSAGNTGILNHLNPNKLIVITMILRNSWRLIFPVGKTFEQLYLASREKEHRVYTDEQVARLPNIELITYSLPRNGK